MSLRTFCIILTTIGLVCAAVAQSVPLVALNGIGLMLWVNTPEGRPRR